MQKIAVIAGDGIGPEVTREAVLLLRALADAHGLPLALWELDLGAERYLRDGVTLPGDVLKTIERDCSAVLLGALGDARVPGLVAREILFGLRFGLDLYANVRPVKALAERLVPLKNCGKTAVDFVVFRENTEGAYAGIGGQLRRGTSDEIAINEDVNTRKGVERILRAAFEHAVRVGWRRVTMADKSNAMWHAHELWRRTFDQVKSEYPAIEARHLYVDALCLHLIQDPGQFEVIVTNNLFGDIVTDLGAALQGGLGMAASANLHPAQAGHVALFEPVHGSAPELVGKNQANPFASFLTAGLLLEHLGWPELAARIEGAVSAALDAGRCTPDVGGALGTDGAGAAVRELLARA